MAELTVGQVVDGRYELEAVIGKGGMGCVFRARHVITHGKVALKVLTDTVDAEAQQRFLAEARAASTIGHPAIVAVSDASRTSDGQLYLVMELLAGKPLRDSLRAGLPGDQIRRVGLELLDALGVAHRQGIVHRDLKPENIFLLAGTGAVKVLDFGIAKVLGATTTTVTGHILGTLEYMAPEQLLDAATVDGRADLWATGIILYELIAGVRPFGGATREAKYTALATEEPMAIEDVVSVSPDVAEFFRVALARDPDRRFQTAADMSAALRKLSMVPQTSAHAAQTEVGATLGTGAAPWANVPDLRHSVIGARALTGSIPPPLSHNAPHLSGHAMQAPVASASPGKKIALAGMGLVVAFGIAFGVVMATRGKKADDTKLADAASSRDAAVIVATSDASKPDASVLIVDQLGPPGPRPEWTLRKPGPPIDISVPITSKTCKAHCDRLEKCGLKQVRCVDQCDRGAACLDEATTCEALAKCYWSNLCQKPVTDGGRSCIDLGICLDKYKMQDGMACSFCLEQMAPDSAFYLAQIKICESNALQAKDTSKAFSDCDKLRDACVAH